MPYRLNPLLMRSTDFAAGLERPAGTVTSSNLAYAVWSVWLSDPLFSFTHDHHAFNLTLSDYPLSPATYWQFGIGIDYNNSVDVAVVRQSSLGTQTAFNGASDVTTWPACQGNVLVSMDLIHGVAQVYINDAPKAFTVSDPPASWFTAGIPFSSSTVTDDGYQNGGGYVSDHWFGQTASFVDLTITANRRKFINADLSPVDLGATGSGPFGTSPTIFQTIRPGGVASDFLINRGTAGGTFVTVGATTIQAPGDPCVPPAPPEQTLIDSELLFRPQNAFTDFSNVTTRRLFVASGGTPQWMERNGALPFDAVPPVYLTTLGAPTDFASNNGSGGAFAPSDIISPAGGPGCTPYLVTEAAGSAANPEWRLSVSDDGGRTWSRLVRPRSIGALGEFLTRVRWMKMGQSRERMIKLECTDAVRRNIVGVYIDADQGMS